MSDQREVREDQHGTQTGYVYGCRCYRCSAASRAYHRQYAAAHRTEITTARRESRQQASESTFSIQASYDEVRLWANSLGFSIPARWGKAREQIIARYNREHPDRPYLSPSERSA